MAVLKSKDGKELLVDCSCGCNDGIRFRIDKFDEDIDCYCFMSYTNGNWYRDQNNTLWKVFCKKLKKIWAIIRNKDYYYAEITMTKDEFNEFKEYINFISSRCNYENSKKIIS